MNTRFLDVANSVSSFIPLLEKERSLTSVGSVFLPLRSENLMRDVTFSEQPIDCLLFAMDHLNKGDNDIKKSFLWLNKVHEAYNKKPNPTSIESLAYAISLDIIAQLNGLRLEHAISTIDKINALLNDNPVNDKSKLTDNLEATWGLLGYYLGHGRELNDHAEEVYLKALSYIQNTNHREEINRRINAVISFKYLQTTSTSMADILSSKANTNKYIVSCLSRGRIPVRPKDHGEMANGFLEGAALTVFMPPVALFAIPAALISWPVLRTVDAYRYHRDQNDNELYYDMLDQANQWRDEFLTKQAQVIYPDLQKTTELVKGLASKMESALDECEHFMNTYEVQLSSIKQDIKFNQHFLDKDQLTLLSAAEKNISDKKKLLREVNSKMRNRSDKLSYVKDYLLDKKTICETNNNHIQTKIYYIEKFNGQPMSSLSDIINSIGEKFDRRKNESSELLKEIHNEILSLKKTSTEIITTAKAREEQKKGERDQLMDNSKKMF